VVDVCGGVRPCLLATAEMSGFGSAELVSFHASVQGPKQQGPS